MLNIKILNKTLQIENEHTIELKVNSIDQNFKSYGIYGRIEIKKSEFIIFITGVILAGQFFNNDVYEISEVKIVHISGPCEKHYTTNIKQTLENSGIYFINTVGSESTKNLFSNISFDRLNNQVDDIDFIFNYVPIANIEKYDKNIKRLAVKCIQGYFNMISVGNIKLTLISRRSWRRCGSRFFSRGSDFDGYVSNFVETEQIIQIDDQIAFSFLQIRGSIPLVWSHDVGLTYAPKIVISKEQHAFEKSKKILKSKYDNIFYLNLIKHKGYEGKIYKEFVKYQAEIDLLNFDFHNSGITKNPNGDVDLLSCFDNVINKFGARISNNVLNNFEKEVSNNVIRIDEDRIKNIVLSDAEERISDRFQKGIIRTNCIDCLDRTNLVQFYIAKYLINQFCKYAFSNDQFVDFEKYLRYLWYENGNKLSHQYAGTPAIKSDIIRFKRITLTGLGRDFYFSVKRYYLNRFKHGDLQDSYRILTGKFKPAKNSKQISWLRLRCLRIFWVLLCIWCLISKFNVHLIFVVLGIFSILLENSINLPSSEEIL